MSPGTWARGRSVPVLRRLWGVSSQSWRSQRGRTISVGLQWPLEVPDSQFPSLCLEIQGQPQDPQLPLPSTPKWGCPQGGLPGLPPSIPQLGFLVRGSPLLRSATPFHRWDLKPKEEVPGPRAPGRSPRLGRPPLPTPSGEPLQPLRRPRELEGTLAGPGLPGSLPGGPRPHSPRDGTARRRRPGARRFLNPGGPARRPLARASLLPRLRFQAARRPGAAPRPPGRPPANAAPGEAAAPRAHPAQGPAASAGSGPAASVSSPGKWAARSRDSGAGASCKELRLGF